MRYMVYPGLTWIQEEEEEEVVINLSFETTSLPGLRLDGKILAAATGAGAVAPGDHLSQVARWGAAAKWNRGFYRCTLKKFKCSFLLEHNSMSQFFLGFSIICNHCSCPCLSLLEPIDPKATVKYVSLLQSYIDQLQVAPPKPEQHTKQL